MGEGELKTRVWNLEAIRGFKHLCDKNDIDNIFVEAKGYIFDGIVPFKKKDRIKYHRKGLKTSLTLGVKVKDIPRELFELLVK